MPTYALGSKKGGRINEETTANGAVLFLTAGAVSLMIMDLPEASAQQCYLPCDCPTKVCGPTAVPSYYWVEINAEEDMCGPDEWTGYYLSGIGCGRAVWSVNKGSGPCVEFGQRTGPQTCGADCP